MNFRTLTTTVALAVLLAIVGALTGPQWNPKPVAEHIVPVTSDTAIGLGRGVVPVGTYEIRETAVTVQLDGTQVSGMLREPRGAGDGLPGAVFLHGAGTGDSTTAFRQIAQALASSGVVTLVPSKRLDTYSTRHRDYVASAQDYRLSVEYLRAVSGVDPTRVGIYAESEGTWSAPVIASRDPGLGFLVLVSAPVVRPREQTAFAVDAYLRNTDVPGGVFRAIPRAVGMSIPGGGFEYADFDVQPYLRQVRQPILVVYGTNDASMPVEQGATQVIDTARENGNNGVSVRYYRDANHGIKVEGALAPNFAQDTADWINALPASATAAPQIAGAQPNQPFRADPVPTPRWFRDGDVALGLVIAALIFMVAAALVMVALKVRRRYPRDSAHEQWARTLLWPLAVLSVGAVATLGALVAYLVSVARLALNYQKDAWVVQGGWLGVRVLGVAALVAGAIAVNRSRDWRKARQSARSAGAHGEAALQMGRGTGIALWLMALGASILLVTLAYWGVYQLGI